MTAQDNTTRDQNLANLFTNLGHLTHLVADVSVPEHSRNDAHLLYNYESWCLANLPYVSSPIDGERVFVNTLPPDDAIFAMGVGRAFGSNDLSPISNLWDSRSDAATDGGYNNSALWGRKRLAGLADYSNYNYFSGDTVFRGYDHPSRDDAELYPTIIQIAAPDGLLDNVIYYRGLTSEGILVPHLAATDLLYQDWITHWGGRQIPEPAHLDPYCWQDYAKDLVPRAVSYGTALVNYFFRGKFWVTSQGNTLTVQNPSPGAVSGRITIFKDDADGRRAAVPGFVDREVSLASGEALQWHDFNPSPASFDNQYRLVFRGTMENAGAGSSTTDDLVAGKAFPWTPPSAPAKIIVGGSPRGLAVTPDGEKLYVANGSTNSVSVVSLATGTASTPILVGSAPADVAIAATPAGVKVFVSNEWGRSVSVIDAATDTVIHTIGGLPSFPEDMAVSPDGRVLYLAHRGSPPLSRIDTGAYGAVSSQSPGNLCQGIAFYPNGASSKVFACYYTVFWDKSVAAADPGNLSFLGWMTGPPKNWSVAVAGGKLYVARADRVGFNPDIYAVGIYDPSTYQWLGQVPVGRGPRGVTAGFGGSRLFVTNKYDDTVSVIDTATDTVLGIYRTGDGPHDTALSPDGAYLFVSNSFDGSISVIPTNTPLEPATPTGQMAPMAMAASVPSEANTWGSAVLAGLPQGCRVYADGESPRWEEDTAEGYAVFFPAGTRTLHLFCPGYRERSVVATVGAGETVFVDGALAPE